MMDSKFLLLALSTLSITFMTPGIVHGQDSLQVETLEAPSSQLSPPPIDSTSSPEAAPSTAPSSPPVSPQPAPPEAQSSLDENQEALVAALKLTNEQKNQFQSIQSLLQAQVKSILTPQQIQQVDQLRSTGQQPDFSTLNLSSSQQSQVKEAQSLAEYRFALLLTPTQKKALKNLSK